MKVVPVSYNKFFTAVKSAKFESTKQVVDSIFQYERLVNYRMRVTKGNDNYWFLSNLLELTLKSHGFYNKIAHSSKSLDAQYLLNIMDEFEAALKSEYYSWDKMKQIHCVRDTIKCINVWIEALNKLKNDEN